MAKQYLRHASMPQISFVATMNRFTSIVFFGTLLLALLVATAKANVVMHRDTFAYGGHELDDQLDFGDNDRPTDHVKIARDIVHKSEWTAFGTNSATKELAGFPMVNIISVADSKRGAPSTGNIYFMLTNLDYTGQDLMKSNRLTLLFSQDQDLECSKKGTDPMEPTCARVIISGKAIVMDNSTAEYKFGFEAFVDRHPASANWIAEHNFYLCKVDIASVIVLDWYGGPHHVTAEDYFKHSSVASVAAAPQVATNRGTGDNGRRRTIRIHVEPATNDVLIEV